ncbi:MAG: zinc-ribbon domain-containing protein [Ruminococcus sp.]|nr:zinc-ribbon domain-containing protein [Ruminococcus sp.]
MGNYTGSKCLSCGRTFGENEDIVVCPECGTPYHRDCYLKEGKCINIDLHARREAWRPEGTPAAPAVTVEKQPDTVRCIRCGAENPAGERTCRQCGTPLVNMEASRPFNGFEEKREDFGGIHDGPYNGTDRPGFGTMMFNQDSVIDGVKLGDYARYVGTNPIGFLPNFIRFGKFGKKLSFNFFAFLFTSAYLMYRKMLGWGLLTAVISALLGVPDMIYMLEKGTSGGLVIDLGIDLESASFVKVYNLMFYLSVILKIVVCVTANYLYYKQAHADIMKIRAGRENEDDDAVKLSIMTRGGTSWGYVLLGLLVNSIVSIGTVVVIGKMLTGGFVL